MNKQWRASSSYPYGNTCSRMAIRPGFQPLAMIITLKPSFWSLLTLAGEAATRHSPGQTSRGTPIFICFFSLTSVSSIRNHSGHRIAAYDASSLRQNEATLADSKPLPTIPFRHRFG